ncbi:ATP-binding protein [Roseicyclus marinus]|uniref:ATP-binding protein n=1 Tax=Roseicyclus marinus TaxID=2161673 RepID=UPI00240EA991|nr:ATP-binding protein [Roseicyclus marinus]MDG3041053.1 ATP-binding protein [Roseicyclus marinus]
MRRRLVNLRFAASGAAVREALMTVDATLAAAGAVEDLRMRAQIALAEACNNIVEHAYPLAPDPDAQIRLDISGDAGGLQITLRDRGRSMPEGPLPGRTFPCVDPENPDTLPEGGFGWPLLRTMTRALSISRQNGQNILRFRLLLADRTNPVDENAV